MKQKTRWLALLLTLVMLLALCACGGSGSTPAQSDSTPASDSAPAEEPAAADSPFPLAAQANMKMWMSQQPFLMMYNIDMNNITYYKELERMTNVHLDIQAVPMFGAAEQFNIMMGSGDYPDFINGFENYYTNGTDEAIDQEIIFDLMPFLNDGKMPHYKAALDEKEVFWLNSLTPSGSIGSANMLFSTEEGLTGGYSYRKDWMDQIGCPVPETIQELHDYLAAVQTEIGVNGPLFMYKTGVDASGVLISAYDTIGWVMDQDTVFLNKDGVVFGPTEEGYRDYLIEMNKWYAEGLINPDFSTIPDQELADYILNGSTAVSTAERGTFSFIYEISGGEIELHGMSNMKLTKEQQLHVGKKSTSFIYGTSITSGTSDLDLAVAWLDFCYTDEATLVGNYGIEGEARAYDENGDPMLTDLVLHNPDGKDVIVAIAEYTNYGGAMRYYADRYNSAYNDIVLEAIQLWEKDNDMAYMLPTTMAFSSADAGSEYANIMGDIKTYVQEYTNNCITGAADPAATWEEYIGKVEAMNIARATELMQEAYDIYLSKTQYLD